MIVVTGDTHRDFSRLSNRITRGFIGEGDYVIVAGDFGLCWARDKEFNYWVDILSKKSFTTLFVDGNHENFDILNEYDVEEWNGGKVHQIIRDKVIHLMRGQVFNIEDRKIFTFGGAASHDIQGGVLSKNDENFKEKVRAANRLGLPYRVTHESWWEEEMPNEAEYKEGINNLEKNNWKVDYVITHAISSRMLPDIATRVGIRKMEKDALTEYFDMLENKLQYTKWYCGHYHTDSILDRKHRVLYKVMEELR